MDQVTGLVRQPEPIEQNFDEKVSHRRVVMLTRLHGVGLPH